jgi:hypothetical protein
MTRNPNEGKPAVAAFVDHFVPVRSVASFFVYRQVNTNGTPQGWSVMKTHFGGFKSRRCARQDFEEAVLATRKRVERSIVPDRRRLSLASCQYVDTFAGEFAMHGLAEMGLELLKRKTSSRMLARFRT